MASTKDICLKGAAGIQNDAHTPQTPLGDSNNTESSGHPGIYWDPFTSP